jgi:hypothetical protein
MGAVLTAELIAEAGDIRRFRSADALAAAAGLAPVLRQSGKVRFLRRPTGGNKGLKRVFYQVRVLFPRLAQQPGLLRPQARRGQATPPRAHRARLRPHRRALGDAPHGAVLPGRIPERGLTEASGCRLLAVGRLDGKKGVKIATWIGTAGPVAPRSEASSAPGASSPPDASSAP